MKLDRTTKSAILAEVRDAIRQTLETAEERWLTGDELVSQFGCFTKSWLKSYGHLLPRTQAIVSDHDGEHRTTWCYPQHRINSMLLDGRIQELSTRTN